MTSTTILPNGLRQVIPAPRNIDISPETKVYCRLFHPASVPQTDYFVIGGYNDSDDYMLLVYTHGIGSTGCVGHQPLSSLEECGFRGLSYERDLFFTSRTLAEVAAPEFLECITR